MAAAAERVNFLEVQSDWNECLSAPAGSKQSNEAPNVFWVNARFSDHTVYGRVQVHIQPDGRTSFEGEHGFDVANLHGNKRRATMCFQQQSQTFTAASRLYNNVLTQRSGSCIDVSSAGDLALCGGGDGELRVLQTGDGTITTELKTHFGDVNCCKWFPSNKVALSGGADTRVCIWNVETAEVAATLKGHTAGVLDVGIIDRGRNVISCGRDGTCKVWDVPTQTVICDYNASNGSSDRSAVNCCNLASYDSLEHQNTTADPREVSTDDKVIFTGSDDGCVRCFDIRGRCNAFQQDLSVPVNSVVASATNYLMAAGCNDGKLAVFDVRNLKSVVNSRNLQRTDSPILKLHHLDGAAGTVWAANGDGSVVHWDLQKLNIVEELTGAEEAVVSVSGSPLGNHLYTLSRSGIVRKYVLGV
eukprot:GILJ01008086.1.p1 GENE.GILJ01008086.1~~GILJ01008086.1.p1  ORF type:complete len:433 (-),score=57.46 GILJ01008086.1:124-1371(-)